jgi:hypothetical protein
VTQDLLAIVVLKEAPFFAAELPRALRVPVEMIWLMSRLFISTETVLV